MPQAGDLRTRRKHLLRVPSSPVPRRGNTSFALLDRARPVCLRPKSRRFAAVGLRHAPAGAVSFPSGRKTGPPRGLPRGERRKERSRAQSPPQAGTEWAEFLPRKTGPPRGLPRGERRKERSRAQSPPQAGTEWAEFLPTTWGVQCTSHRWYPIRPARRASNIPRFVKASNNSHIINIEGDHT